MTNYIPYHSKKRERRERLESVLLRILGNGGPQEDVVRAAEAVREARVRELRSRRAELPAMPGFATELAAIDEQIAAWNAMSLDAIVDFYRQRSRNSVARGAVDERDGDVPSASERDVDRAGPESADPR